MDRKEYLLRQLTAKREEYQHLRDSAFYRTDSTLLIASATMIAIVATFDNAAVSYSLCLFRTVSILLGTACILAFAVALFSYSRSVKRVCRTIDREIEALHGVAENDVPYGLVLESPDSKVYRISEVTGYVSFVLFIIGLAAMAVSK